MDITYALGLEGFTSAGKLNWLYKNAKGRCLEIGTYGGRSAYAIGSSADSLICIDRWEDYLNIRNYPIEAATKGWPSFSRLLREHPELPITYINKESDEAHHEIENESLDFLFIDGAHDYDSVRSDLTNYIPKVKPGSLLVGDDYNLSEVRDALESLNMGVSILDTLWYCHKD